MNVKSLKKLQKISKKILLYSVHQHCDFLKKCVITNVPTFDSPNGPFDVNSYIGNPHSLTTVFLGDLFRFTLSFRRNEKCYHDQP